MRAGAVALSALLSVVWLACGQRTPGIGDHAEVSMPKPALNLPLAATRTCAPETFSGEKLSADRFAEQLIAVGDLLQEKGRVAEAETAACSLLDRAERAFSLRSAKAADARDLLVRVLYLNGKRREPTTLALARQAVRLREEIQGPDDPALAVSLRNLASLLKTGNELEEAYGHLERSLEIRQAAYGADSLEVADSLGWLGSLLADMGEGERAKASLEHALQIREQQLGEHWEIAQTLSSLANLTCNLGDYHGCNGIFQRALEMYRATLPPVHPLVARGLHNVGAMHHTLGNVEQAFAHYRQALAVRREVYGEIHSVTAYTHTALAMLLRETGEPAEARGHFRIALDGLEEGLKKDHPDYTIALTNLALLLQESGDYNTARRLQEQTLQVRRAALLKARLEPEDNAGIGLTKARLGVLALEIGDLALARRELGEALAIQERALGPEHHELRDALVGLARVAQEVGDVATGRRLLERILRIFDRLEPRHPQLIEPLILYADVETAAGNHANARRYLDRGTAIAENMLARSYPWTARLMTGQARVSYALGEEREALEIALRATAIARARIRRTVRALAEREALHFAGTMKASRDLSLSLLASNRPASPTIRSRVWDAVIRSRALVLDESIARHRLLNAGSDPELQRLALAWDGARRELSRVLVRAADELSASDQRQLVHSAREAVEAEHRIAEKLLVDRTESSGPDVGFDEVAAHLPPRSALLAFTLFDRLAPAADARRWNGQPGASYLAFVLLADSREPVSVDLGPAATIDAHVADLRARMHQGFDGSAQGEDTYRIAGAKLRQRVWDPLLPYLAGVSQVFLVPDGSLNLVNLASLPVGEVAERRYLIDDGPLVHHLTAEKELVAFDGPRPAGRGLLAVGAVDFSDRSAFAAGAVPSEPGAFAESSLTALFAGARHRGSCGDTASRLFVGLPATATEVREVSELWTSSGRPAEVRRLTAGRAQEESLKRLAPGRRVLHLATHGFALSDRCMGSRTHGDAAMASVGLSGLALAGANHRRLAQAGEEDGILAADEVAALNLSGVEWVVLSACDTGLGEIRAGEGVFGLRRAFRVAGARTVIMSLWAVEDQSARAWMKALYHERLRQQADTAQAVHRASLKVLQDRREAGHSTHPVFWAGFIAAGDWR